MTLVEEIYVSTSKWKAVERPLHWCTTHPMCSIHRHQRKALQRRSFPRRGGGRRGGRGEEKRKEEYELGEKFHQEKTSETIGRGCSYCDLRKQHTPVKPHSGLCHIKHDINPRLIRSDLIWFGSGQFSFRHIPYVVYKSTSSFQPKRIRLEIELVPTLSLKHIQTNADQWTSGQSNQVQ